MTYRVGHPAYSGANGVEHCPTIGAALDVLCARGASLTDAIRAVREAAGGSLATLTNRDGQVIEVCGWVRE